MRAKVVLWAAVLAAAHALLASCTQPNARPAESSLAEPAASVILPASQTLSATPEPAHAEELAPAHGAQPLAPRPASDASAIAEFATRVEPNRVPVPPLDAPSRGPANAPVTLQIWSDFECPYCARAGPLLRELEAEFGGTVRVVWRNYPLPMHPQARLAAVAALEAYRARGGAAFWRTHDALFAATVEGGLDDRTIERLASLEGVSAGRLRRAVAERSHDVKIDADVSAGDAAGVQGTPAFLVNGWLIVGLLPYDALRAVVRQALAEL